MKPTEIQKGDKPDELQARSLNTKRMITLNDDSCGSLRTWTWDRESTQMFHYVQIPPNP